MTNFAVQALRDTLAASYEDPTANPALSPPDLTVMLDDVVRRIAAVNAARHRQAMERVMSGLENPASLEELD